MTDKLYTKNKWKEFFFFYQGEEREKGEQKKKVHRSHTTSLLRTCTLPSIKFWCITPNAAREKKCLVVKGDRARHLKGMNSSHLLVCNMCIARTNYFFKIYFIYVKRISCLQVHLIIIKNYNKMTRTPLNISSRK
jgi:hypothetical protein